MNDWFHVFLCNCFDDDRVPCVNLPSVCESIPRATVNRIYLFVAVSRCSRELKVPVTCKIRIFDDVQRTVEYAQMLERAGAKVQKKNNVLLYH